MSNSEKQIVVGLSGGVDSATCAYLLKAQGYHVVGIYMQNWQPEGNQDCPVETDLKDAQQCAREIGIEFDVINFSKDYWDRVFEKFLAAYQLGQTPNPDVLCNQEIKFQAFQDYVLSTYQSPMATGHYAQIQTLDNQYQLLKGTDPNKDQSYFLCRLNQKQLRYSNFPIGGYNKSQIRTIARENNIPVYAKKDSTGICFIGERKFNEFLSQYLLDRPGPIIELDSGKILGQHQGLIYYTIGQRKGIGIGASHDQDSPWYVANKDLKEQALYVVQGSSHNALNHLSLKASALHWVRETLSFPVKCQAKIRYRHSPQDATIYQAENGTIRVDFDQPQWAITPGQYVVFYQNDELIASAIIESPL